MNIVEKKLAELTPYENNPRNNEAASEYVANSIRQFGFKVPIVIDKNNVIVCGHTRYLAAHKLNMKTVPCIVADDLTDEQIKAYRLADNKVAEKATWDFNLLDEELGELFAVDINMEDFGFDPLISDTDFGTDFSLPDGGKNEICQMTLTLHEKQKELIEYCMTLVQDQISETFGNTNKNGNSVYEVVRQWAEQRK